MPSLICILNEAKELFGGWLLRWEKRVHSCLMTWFSSGWCRLIHTCDEVNKTSHFFTSFAPASLITNLELCGLNFSLLYWLYACLSLIMKVFWLAYRDVVVMLTHGVVSYIFEYIQVNITFLLIWNRFKKNQKLSNWLNIYRYVTFYSSWATSFWA